jgi:hypothetical protein
MIGFAHDARPNPTLLPRLLMPQVSARREAPPSLLAPARMVRARVSHERSRPVEAAIYGICSPGNLIIPK